MPSYNPAMTYDVEVPAHSWELPLGLSALIGDILGFSLRVYARGVFNVPFLSVGENGCGGPYHTPQWVTLLLIVFHITGFIPQ